LLKKLSSFATPFKDDIRQLADLHSKYHKRW